MRLLRPILLLAPLAAACEPATVTEARDQLGSAGVRIVTLSVPVAIDTLTMDSVFVNFLNVPVTTIAGGIMAVAVDSQRVRVAVGDSVGPVAGPLDPDVNPLLRFDFEETAEFPRLGFNLGEFEGAVQDATLNAVPVVLAFVNSADAPLRLDNFVFGVARLQANGQPMRDIGGNVQFETDGQGNPILVSLVDPGDTVFTIPRRTPQGPSARTDTIPMAALVDRLVDLVLGGNRAGLVAQGRALVGDGSAGTVSANDSLAVSIAGKIGFDLTLGAAGAAFDSSVVESGLDIDESDANSLAERVDEAMVRAAVENGTPYRLELSIAAARGAVSGDVFTAPGAVVLPTLSVAAATVNANGLAQSPVSSSVMVSITGQQALTFMGPTFTAGMRVRLFAPSQGNRGALRPSDRIVVRSGATVKLRSGGGS